MSITKRIGRLLRADIHGILDTLEDPESVLKQALRDMEEALRAEAEQVKQAERSIESVARRSEAIGKAIAESGEKVALAFRAGNEDLARGLLRRKLEDERCAAAFEQERKACAQSLDAAKARLSERREELERIRIKANLFLRECAAAERSADDPFRSRVTVTDAEVELAFIEAKLRHSGDRNQEERA
jgi:phage shock protein A